MGRHATARFPRTCPGSVSHNVKTSKLLITFLWYVFCHRTTSLTVPTRHHGAVLLFSSESFVRVSMNDALFKTVHSTGRCQPPTVRTRPATKNTTPDYHPGMQRRPSH